MVNPNPTTAEFTLIVYWLPGKRAEYKDPKLTPKIQLGNTHISVNNPENKLKFGRTDSLQLKVK